MPTEETRAEKFGRYIREAREAIGATVRTAAPKVGVSYGHLAKLERGEILKPPSLHVLSLMAALYGKPVEEMMDRAGVRFSWIEPQTASGEEQFKRLMLSAEFGPPTMKEEYLLHFPALHRALIQQLVFAVESHTERRVRWDLRGDEEAPCTPPVSMLTYAEIIGAGTTKVVIDDDWEDKER
jgi:transcriptional regulator with XRE-family HTH domain